MLRILIIIILFLYLNLSGAQNTLLEDQLKALSRQLDTSSVESDELDPKDDSAYNYNQNVVYHRPNYVKEGLYVGANKFIGYFKTNSDIHSYNVKESTSFTYFKAGYIFKTNNRMELTFINEAKLSYTTFLDKLTGLNINAIIPYTLNSAKNIHLKMQGGVGVYDYSAYSLEGLSANAALGVIGDITNDIEVDISYIYRYIYWRDLESIISSTPLSSTNLMGITFGAKYKF